MHVWVLLCDGDEAYARVFADDALEYAEREYAKDVFHYLEGSAASALYAELAARPGWTRADVQAVIAAYEADEEAVHYRLLRREVEALPDLKTAAADALSLLEEALDIGEVGDTEQTRQTVTALRGALGRG